MTHLGLFEGIGGFSLAVKWAGGKTLAWCEWNEFGQKVLRHHFPEAEGFGDITKTDFRKYEGQIELLTGGFPCQPFSLAGKRKGTDDERYLWHEMLRAIQEIKPRYIIAENVFGIVNIDGGMVFEQVCADMENEGYEVQPFIIPACAKDAPHRRDRCWFIGVRNATDTNSWRNKSKQNLRQEIPSQKRINRNGGKSNATNTKNVRRKDALENGELEGRRLRFGDQLHSWNSFPLESPICGGDDGIPTQLDGITFSKWRNESIKAYGNAIVPQVAFEIIKQLFYSIL